MKLLLKLSHTIDQLNEQLGQLSAWLVVITIVIGFTNVFTRYVGRFVGLRLSSNLAIELQWYLYTLIFFTGFAYILKHGVNVRVDFLSSKWPRRRQVWIDIVGHLLFLVPFCLIAIYVTINPVLLSWGRLPDGSWGNWEVSPDPDGLPRAPIKSMIIVAFTCLLLQTLSELIKYVAFLKGVPTLPNLATPEEKTPLRVE